MKRITYGILWDSLPSEIFSGRLPFWSLLLGAVSVFFFACFLWEMAEREHRASGCRAEAVLVCKGRQIKVKAFLDTGNQLYDPFFRRPVSVIWEGALDGLFDGTEGAAVIPYRSVGQEKGMLPAVSADGIRIEINRQKRYFKKPLIAVSRTPLSSDGSYELLLHPEVWEQAVLLSREPWKKRNGRKEL